MGNIRAAQACAAVLLFIAFFIPASLATPAAAAEKIIWNHNYFGPKREVTRGIETAAAMLEKASGGTFALKIHYGAALGPPKTVPEAIKSGGYEGGNLCVGYYPNKFPLLSVMELPFLAPSKITDRAKVDAAILAHPLIRKLMAARWNLFPFEPTTLPAYEFMGNRKIASTADMKGVKTRISGLNAKALAKFGAVPAMVPAPETYTALERGTIDMIGLPYSYGLAAYKLYEVSKYSTEDMAMGGFMCFQGVNLGFWDRMPAKLRDMHDNLVKASSEALITAYAAADKKWIPVFRQHTEVHKFPKAERKKLQSVASGIWEEWVKEQEDAGRPGRKILDFVKAEVAKYE
ncbi:MAG: TRAP transporter substrate-binding protein DctP [Hyphomicrobiaceae bacterium]